MGKKEIEKQLAVLEILNTEIPFKYPKGSTIVFCHTESMPVNERGMPNTYSCSWYDKVGIGFPLKNIVRKPQEWQNLSREKAQKIWSMFDTPIILEFTTGLCMDSTDST